MSFGDAAYSVYVGCTTQQQYPQQAAKLGGTKSRYGIKHAIVSVEHD